MGGSAVAAVGAVAGGMLGSKGADDAADASSDASMAAAIEGRRQFNVTQKNMAPFLSAGHRAVNEQQKFLGLYGREPQKRAFRRFWKSPGQEFMETRAQRNLIRNSAAIGGLGGGNVRTALVNQGAGFAAQQYQQHLNNLGGLSGAGNTTATNLGGLSNQNNNNTANLLQNAGDARSSGILSGTQAKAGILENLTGIYANRGN